MPQSNNLSAIFQCLHAEKLPANKKNHFLFLLGTGAKFTPKPTAPEKYYERGETLSYAAKTIATLLGESEAIPPTAPLSFCTPSIDVLNGPTTMGSQVGELIAEAILKSLHAAALGKEALQILAHSRGAVEGILLMHELARIKKALADTPDKSLWQILTESPCKLTRDGLLKKMMPCTEEDTSENRELLRIALNSLKINAFLIDPVPGDISYSPPGVSWYDARFYQKTPCDNYELLICRDERSNFFYPIVPNDMKPTVLPGHHGTPIGNLYTQQYLSVPDHLKHLKATDVQDLVLCKLLYFLHQTIGIFSPVDSQLSLEHTELDLLVNKFLSADEPHRKQQLLNMYVEVAKNDDVYRYFSETHYAYLSRKAAPGNHRYVHFHTSDYVSMGHVMPQMHDNFVNREHTLLHLENHFNVSTILQTKIDVQVTAITCILKNIILEMKGICVDKPLLTIIMSEPGLELFFNNLTLLVDSVCKNYLHHHLPLEERKRLTTVISLPFLTLSEAMGNEELQAYKPLIERCENVLQMALKQTIESEYNAFIIKCDQIHHQTQFCSIDHYLYNIERLYNEASELLESYPELKYLVSQKNLIDHTEQLSLRRHVLITTAAGVLKDHRSLFLTKPKIMSEAFYHLANNQDVEALPAHEHLHANLPAYGMIGLSTYAGFYGRSTLFFCPHTGKKYAEESAELRTSEEPD